MSSTGRPQGPSEEELRAAYEEQLKQLRVEHVIMDNVAALVNLGMRRTGLAPGTESERDPAQVRLAIESVRALLPQLEEVAPSDIGQIRSALSQLQLAYVRIGGQPAGAGNQPGAGAPGAPAPDPGPAEGPGPGPAAPGSGPGARPEAPAATPPGSGSRAEPGPAQRSGRLWVPGQ